MHVKNNAGEKYFILGSSKLCCNSSKCNKDDPDNQQISQQKLHFHPQEVLIMSPFCLLFGKSIIFTAIPIEKFQCSSDHFSAVLFLTKIS